MIFQTKQNQMFFKQKAFFNKIHFGKKNLSILK